MKRLLCMIVLLALVLSVLPGCNLFANYSLNNVSITDYTIVYDADGLDYNKRAAEYIRDEIWSRTGALLRVVTDDKSPFDHEIVVGETNRDISAALNEDTEGFEFSIMADGAHVALEGDYFVIAAAAYYFVNTFILKGQTSAIVSTEPVVHTPITKEAENIILLIGDGMGFNQTTLFDVYSAEEMNAYSDGESAFYGYMFPYQGEARTDSLEGTTDSAASGTALATGFKTDNGRVGMDSRLNVVKNFVEIAAELGKSTAVMTTESLTGATPAAFTAHVASRGADISIANGQKSLVEKYGTLILGNYGAVYDAETVENVIEKELRDTLKTLAKDKDGFFMMYEEAYFDKHSHSNELENTFLAGLRFNQIIGTVMEFAFYNPDTLVLITADHETGGITKSDDGSYYYTTENHTSANVPVFAFGRDVSVFHNTAVENIQIPKTFAAMWGVELEGYMNEEYPSLLPVAQK